MNRTLRALIAVIFVGIITFCGISIAQNVGRRWRADITERKLYTLSAGTKSILSKLHDPITVQLYYAKTAALKGPDQIRFFNNYYQFVNSLLQEYEIQSQGKLHLKVIDPRPYSDDEMDAMRYGLKKFPITEDENFFFGLVLHTEFGVTKSIPFFSPDRQQFVEYDVSYLIDTAINPQKKRIGVLSSLPVMGEDASGYMAQMKRMQGERTAPPWNIITQLQQQFDVKKVESDAAQIDPKDYDILLVIHPRNLPDKTLFAIDQFVLNGGRTIVCVDPHCVAEQATQKMNPYQQPQPVSSDLNRLLKTWRLEMPPDTFAGDATLALAASINPEQRPQKIIGFMGLSPECFNHDSAITSDLHDVRVLFPGVLRKVEPAKTDVKKDGKEETPASGPQPETKEPASPAGESPITLTPLLSTTNRGNTWTVSNPYELMMLDPERLMKRFTEGSEPVNMAYLVTGKFRSSFPDGVDVPDEADKEKKDSEQNPNPENKEDAKSKEPAKTKHVTGLTEAAGECVVAVFADVDFISDMMAYQNTIFGPTVVGDNSSLMLNTIDSMTGSNDLISIRSRGSYRRPFKIIDAIEEKAEKDTAAEVDKINAQIAGFQEELEKIASSAKQSDSPIIGPEILAKKKDIELKIHQAQRDLRQVKMKKRIDIEKKGNLLENLNTLAVPSVILVVAIILGVYRGARRRHYISHASDA
jgi:ABC-2 type transport system permease protein